MAGRGRPPAARNIYSIESPDYRPPLSALLDTSFLVEALMSGQTHHHSCANALISMAEEGTELVFSSLLELELVEAAYQVALRQRYGKKWRQARSDGRARSRAAKLAEDALDAWHEALSAFTATRVDAAEVADRVPALMRAHALGSYDAVHVATAQGAGVRTILALDTGFARVPPSDLTIYTVSAKLSRMRALRSR